MSWAPSLFHFILSFLSTNQNVSHLSSYADHHMPLVAMTMMTTMTSTLCHDLLHDKRSHSFIFPFLFVFLFSDSGGSTLHQKANSYALNMTAQHMTMSHLTVTLLLSQTSTTPIGGHQRSLPLSYNQTLTPYILPHLGEGDQPIVLCTGTCIALQFPHDRGMIRVEVGLILYTTNVGVV